MQRRKFLFTTAAAIPVIAIGQNLNSPDDHTKKGFVIKANESRFDEKTLLGGKNPNSIKVSSKDTGNNLTVFEYIGNEKGGPPLHYHLKQDEIFIIIDGEYLFKVGDETYTLKTGDTIFLPRKVPHAFAQITDTGKMYFMFQPSGKMEDFFRTLGALTAPPTPEQGAKIFADNDMKIVGPPLSF
ncbi:MAG: cupin domain-containing protein [Bacteroidota bacterium]